MKFHISCIHDTKGIAASETVANYYPLTLEQVSMLVHVAYAHRKNGQKVADIQKRLNQGIMGMICPPPDDGEIKRRMKIINELFTEAMKSDTPPVLSLLAVQLFENMMLEEDVSVFEAILSKADILTKNIDDLELSVRAHNLLENSDINTIGELIQKTEAEILKRRYAGPKSINEIKAALKGLGLSLAKRN